MTKIIIVQWIPEEGLYGQAMQIIYSTHPQFIKGTRFDFGFFQIATNEGYIITSLPMENCHIGLKDD